jgi:DNA polymerase elongation subunit (family B)
MNDTDVERANGRVLDAIRSHIQHLLTPKSTIDWDDFIITGKLAAHYKTENIPHVNLVKRITSRDPGSAPSIGERFEYVFVHIPKKQIYELAETIDYAKEHNMKPNGLFYINNQLKNPITSFIKLLGPSTLEKCLDIFEEAMCIAQKMQDGQTNINSFFSSDTELDFEKKPLGYGHYGKKVKKTTKTKALKDGPTGNLQQFFKKNVS